MKLSTLLNGVPVRAQTAQDVEITGITEHSDQVEKGNLFVCARGSRRDGHHFAEEAIGRGAAAVVVQHALPQALPQILVTDSKRACAVLSANFFGRPADSLTISGITGTNGKTTTAWILRQLLEQNDCPTGLAGTIQNCAAGFAEPADYTTPEAPQLHALLARMKKQNCTHVVLEASSQALDQQRLFGIRFRCAVFTNLTPEHLDYHHSMEEYYRAKRKLFENCGCAVINIDDPWGARLTREIPGNIIACSGAYPLADYQYSDAVYSPDGTEFTLRTRGGTFRVRIPLPGRCNIENSVCAAAAAIELGVPPRRAFAALEYITPAAGRAQRLELGTPFDVVIDYAHTPDGLQQILQALRPVCRGRLICVFGCGGDRDREKRPLMGAAAVHGSDYVILTSDNPRTEDPRKIMDDILAGMSRAAVPVEQIEERGEAIVRAVSVARAGDLILLAGKGHEAYQIRGDRRIRFDEREIAAEAVRNARDKK
ncbi:MAG: UDP-N-acetylmuramoyl-L-alanyl-D-glutamate--2,6-diaminopimelate ligase [Firmicutes bacterium]|nr:UDP-N-acetylmuramoyl-L-alanyl-D-glutamate--2,6-diaminopimelate ligase [Bacillota bacterium]